MKNKRKDIANKKDDNLNLDKLKEFDGSNADKPIYVAIKGEIYPAF